MTEENNEKLETIRPPDGDAAIIETDYEIGQHNVEKKIWGVEFDLHNPVFWLSGLMVSIIVAFALVAPDVSKEFFEWLRPAITSTFDWFFLSAANIFLIFV